ncbi:methylmalonyl-CoA epimerase [Kroppenstedtia eburnea]|uniref:Methylmalonyl-CoA epimerase n=1 Tax=Kroppenstedtia eburnea TaxID=714067 RepID=A0A1N7IMM9_9BACL|nr:methylmalonyl-CoA epimerase [Kroppenstedtia eburnea]QKI81984.1 methylmalonyl-CoA epimerase [Kroppenstedtia eburnea]SIS38335.1 methylmalonyl-CoA epimerase [Kroppenstedtia eburnea]
MKPVVSPEKIDHVGIAVKSLETAVPLYRDILGLPFLGEETVDSEQVRVAFFRLGEVKVELLEPTSPESPIARFIEKRGEGIHHIALSVKEIEGELEGLAAAGIRLIDERPKPGANGTQVAFLHPKSTLGVLYELCQPGKSN